MLENEFDQKDEIESKEIATLNQPKIPNWPDFESSELLEETIAAIKSLNWTKPTPVQSLCLPYTTINRDVAGFAQTGTGKTGVFLITLAEKLLRARKISKNQEQNRNISSPFCFVLAPTRELAMQIDADAKELFSKLGIQSLAVFGGVEIEKQSSFLNQRLDVVFATPGRLKDFYNRKLISFDNCQLFVCDEADRMFDMGFIADVEFFLDRLPETSQKLLFSATTNDQVKELAFEYLNKPEYISVNPETMTPENIEQFAYHCESKDKLKIMLSMINEHQPECSIIFVNTKITAEWLHFKLNGNQIQADIITGDLPQKKRILLIQKIKEGKIKALIATDVASRGLHISRITHVYNFDLPDDPANYIHRIGRTARAGAKGKAYSLVCEDYGDNLLAINQMMGLPYELKTMWYSTDFSQIKDVAGNPYATPVNQPRKTFEPQDKKHAKNKKYSDNSRKSNDSHKNVPIAVKANANYSKHPQVPSDTKTSSIGIWQLLKRWFLALFR